VEEEEEEYVFPPHDLGEVKKEEEEEKYVLPPNDMGEVKEEEKDDHDHPHQSMGY
jgi:hypothetical protein